MKALLIVAILNILFINILLLRKYRTPLKKLFRRFFRNTLFKLSSKTVKIQAELTNTYDGKSDNLLYIEAFAVLFSKTTTHFIPPMKLKYYCRLLGVGIDKHFFVTNSTLAQAQNIKNIKKQIVSNLSGCFRSDIDSMMLLDFFSSVGVRTTGEIIKRKDYVVVTKDHTFQCNNNKYIYTLGQGGCRVVIVQFDEDGFLLSHYRKAYFSSKLLFDLCEAIICRYPKKLKCFVISYNPIGDSILLKQALYPFCNNIEIYYHDKKEITYNIKVLKEVDLKIYYAESLVKKVKNPRFWQLFLQLSRFFQFYRTSSVMHISRMTKYKEMSFSKFEK